MNRIIIFLIFLLGCISSGIGQNLLGIEGGLEGSTAPTVDNTTINTGAQTGMWTKSNASLSIGLETSNVRSGNRSLSISNSSTTGRRVWAPNIAVNTTSQVVLQYYILSPGGANSQNAQNGVNRNGTETTQGTYSGPTTWTKVTYVPTGTNSTNNALWVVFLSRFASGTQGTVYIDDVSIYTGTSVDVTAPNSPGAVVVNNGTSSTLDVSWSAASGGVDGGGYMVVRYSSNPNADNDPNVNGIYDMGNTYTNGTGSLTGTVRYVGTGTSFTDNVGLSQGTQYWYKVYTYDKAYNYSTESSGNGTTTSSTPALTVSPTTLTGFNYTAGSGPSASQFYSLSGTNLTGAPGDITVSCLTNYEVSKDNSTFSGSVLVPYTSATLASTTIYVRLKAGLSAGSYNGETISNAGGGATTKNVTCSGSVTAAPSITVSPSTLTGFTYIQGAGPSTSQSYTLSGANLVPASGNLTVTASTDYEVSTNNSTFSSSSVTVAYTGGTLANTTIYIRLKSGLTAGTYDGETIVNSGGGAATPQNVTCNGSVSAPTPVLSVSPGTLSGFNYTEASGPSASQSYTLSGVNLTPASDNITVSAAADYEVSSDNSTFTSTSFTVAYTGGTLANTTIYVRLKAGLTAGAYNSETIVNSGGGATDQSVTCNGSVTPQPSIAVSPATLSGFNYTQGAGPSTSQSYTLSGANLVPASGNLTVTASADYQVSTNNSTFSSSSVTVAYTGGTLANTTIYVRLKSGLTAGTYDGETIANSGGGAVSQSVTCNGTVSPPPPAISVTPATLSGFTYFEGFGPSTAQSYSLSGSNLVPATGDITVAASADYEVSSDNISFTSTSFTVAYTGGTLASTTIYVRLKAGLAAGAYNAETVVNSGGGAANQSVTCNGSVSLAASKLVITAITPSSPIAGSGFSVTVQSQNASNSPTNVITSTGFDFSTNGNAGAISGTISGTINAGSNSVTVTGVILATGGTGVTITATQTSGSPSLTPGTSSTFTVLDVASKLAFVNFPATGTVSTNLSSFTVEARRPDNTVDNTYTGSVTLTKASGPGTLGGTVTVNAVAGIATFSAVQLNQAGTYTLNANSGSLTQATSGSVVISNITTATDYFRSKGTGNWGTAGSWESSPDNATWITSTLVPSSTANTITIQSGHTITIAAAATAQKLTVSSGATLTVNSSQTLTVSTGTGTDFQVDGTVTNNGSITTQGGNTNIVNGVFNNAGTFTMNTGSTTLTVNGTFNQNTGGGITNSSTANPSITFASGSFYYHNRTTGVVPTATWNINSTCTLTGVAGASTIPTGLGQSFGNFTYNCPGQTTFSVLGSTAFNPKGLFTVSSTGNNVLEFESGGSGGTYNFDGGVYIDGGTLLNNFDNSGAALEVTVNITGNLTITGSGIYQFGAGAGNATTSGYMSTVNLTGNLTLSSSASYPITCPATNNDGRINFTGSSQQEYTRTSSPASRYVDYVIPVGKTLHLNNSLEVYSESATVFDQVVVNGIFDTDVTGISVTSGSNSRVTVNSGATIKTANPLGLNSALSASIRTINAGANYVFNGATTTAFPTTAQVGSFGNPANVTVNANITTNRAVTMTGVLAFSSGLMTLGDNTFTISGGSITGTDNTKYVVTNGTGYLVQTASTSGTQFPVGPAAGYMPATVTTTSGTSTFQVRVEELNQSLYPLSAPNQCVQKLWMINRTVGTASANVKLQWIASEEGGSFSTANPLRMGHWNATLSKWEEFEVTSNLGDPSVTSSSTFASFSPFAIGNQNALPIELTTFTANLRNRKTYLNWATASEQNNAFFSIERATDGVEFRSIGKVNGAGNSNTPRTYGFVDEKPVAGVNYYRLKQVDFDGHFEYSDIISVTVGKTGSITLSPVPAQDQLHVNLETALVNDGTWQLLDNTGRLIQSGTIPAETFDFDVDVTTLTPGAYFLRMVDGQTVVAKQFQK